MRFRIAVPCYPTHARSIRRLNEAIALTVTKAVGSMWCAYLFAALSLISLPAAIHSHDVIVIVGWIAQTFLQLVLLPLLMVGQNLEAREADKRAKRDDALLCRIDAIVEHHGIQHKVSAKESLLP